MSIEYHKMYYYIITTSSLITSIKSMNIERKSNDFIRTITDLFTATDLFT